MDVESQISDQLKISFFTMRTEDKPSALVYLLRDVIPSTEQTIVFAATRHHVEFLHELLLSCHIDSSCVYGDMDQTSRKINIGKFRAKKTPILIVTDVAARGIDIPLLNNVLNYSFPSTPKLFVHRVGRAARAGRSGMAFNFVDPDEMPYMVDLHLFLGRRLEDTCPADVPGYTLSDMTVDQVHYGCFPQAILDTETECLKETLTHNSQVAPLVKVCDNAYKQYSRSRAEPSKLSIKRSKEVLAKKVHPLFYSHMSDSNVVQEAYLEQLKGFRPAATIFEVSTGIHSIKKNAPSVLMMKTKRKLHNNIIEKNVGKVKAAKAAADDDEDSVDEALNPEEQEEFRTKRKAAREAAEAEEAAVPVIGSKRYLSAADRKKIKKMKLNGENVDVDALWKEKEAAKAVEATDDSAKKFQDEENYIGYIKDTDYAKEEALSPRCGRWARQRLCPGAPRRRDAGCQPGRGRRDEQQAPPPALGCAQEEVYQNHGRRAQERYDQEAQRRHAALKQEAKGRRDVQEVAAEAAQAHQHHWRRRGGARVGPEARLPQRQEASGHAARQQVRQVGAPWRERDPEGGEAQGSVQRRQDQDGQVQAQAQARPRQRARQVPRRAD